MATLLILGSKPEPALPPIGSFDALACANASGRSAATGIMALAIGLANPRYHSVIVSGFSFEITHAYAHNPLIDRLGTTRSKHADTDVMVLRCLVNRHGNISTTEPIVNERAGVPPIRGRGSSG